MTKKQEIQLFNDRRIRTVWDDKEAKWYFSVVDAIEALTGTERPRKYWSDLKVKLKKEGSELSEKIGQLKLTMAWAGKTTKSYKAFKGLTKQNLRDNMTNIELALNTLAEAATTELSKEINPSSYKENVTVARKGGGVAKAARMQLEEQLGRSVISASDSSAFIQIGEGPEDQ